MTSCLIVIVTKFIKQSILRKSVCCFKTCKRDEFNHWLVHYLFCLCFEGENHLVVTILGKNIMSTLALIQT